MTSSCPETTKRIAVIFDYDWSLIDCNSDTYIFEQLLSNRPTVVQDASNAGMQWTRAVDYGFQCLYQDKPETTVDEILDCVAQVPVQDGMLDAVRHAHDKQAKLFIVSDANTAFINAFLQKQGIHHLFDSIVSNKAIVGGERFRVEPFYDFDHLPPHGCSVGCPPNLCKGKVLKENILHKFDQVVYVGDGGGDYCPSTLMRCGSDTVLARQDFRLAQKIAAGPIGARVCEWKTGTDVLRIFREIL